MSDSVKGILDYTVDDEDRYILEFVVKEKISFNF